MGGAATQTALKHFHPLFTLNYSATHKETHNPIYVLDALDAYNQKLVKKIEVVGFELKNLKGTDSYLYLEDIIMSKTEAPKARLELEVKHINGIKREMRNLSVDDDLFYISRELEQYRGYRISDIHVDTQNGAHSTVSFSNGKIMYLKDVFGDISADHKVRIQIRETIKAHFRKEASLFKRGIKTLSLFFIDEVANYRQYDEDGNQQLGRYGEIFEQEYMAELNENQNMFDPDYVTYVSSISAHETHSGYFSIDKKGRSINSDVKRGSDQSDDISAYDLILKNKERLLSFDEPVRFIFSHSALREGWANPNIFQICTLKHSNSEISKRPDIGRGLRICVNSDGERMDYKVLESNFHLINTLTVIASESYDSFAKALQTEISESLSERPKNFTQESFVGKILTNEAGEHYEFTPEHFQDLLIFNVMNGYVDQKDNYKITDKFVEDMENGKLEVMPDLVGFEEQIGQLMKRLYSTNNTKLVSDERRENIKNLVPNANFMKKEFQDLWSKINIKTIYEVDFDTNELIDKAVQSINGKINIAKMQV